MCSRMCFSVYFAMNRLAACNVASVMSQPVTKQRWFLDCTVYYSFEYIHTVAEQSNQVIVFTSRNVFLFFVDIDSATLTRRYKIRQSR